MQKSILAILHYNQGEYISGEEISRQLAVSRSAVWKHIKALREEGYQIESSSRLGYRLVSQLDLLLPDIIQRELETRILGKEIYHYTSLDSTNNKAKSLAQEGSPEGTLVLAEEQTGGKGRLGRQWVSPFAKGLWFSLILRPPIAPMDATKIVILTAVALQEAIVDLTKLPVKIKWPNDLLLGEKKITGILLEMNGELDTINYLVLGIGINVNLQEEDFPESLRERVTSLAVGLGEKLSRLNLLRAVLQKLEEHYFAFLGGEFSFLLEKWKKSSCTLGKRVRVTTPNGLIEGIALDYNQDGSLLVETAPGQIRKITSGDVNLF